MDPPRKNHAAPGSHRALRLALLAGLTLLAFGLRAYHLGAQSYWIDEGWTLHYTALTPAQVWYAHQTVEVVPPLYHLLALGWSRLVGNGEYALRFTALVWGVLSIPLTLRLGTALGDRRLGIIASLLMAVAPYQIWHSQDARHYTMLTAASIVSMWGFVNLWRGRWHWRWGLLLVLGSVWAVLSHYHALLLTGVQALCLLVTWRRQWRFAWRWAVLLSIAPVVAAVTFLALRPELLRAQLAWWLPQPTLWESYVRGAVAYSVGELVPLPLSVWLCLAFVALFVLGLAAAGRHRNARGGRYLLAFGLVYTLAPNLAAWVYGELRTPVYMERYLIPVQVGYLLMVAMGVLAITHGARSILRRRSTWARPAAAGAAAAPLLLLMGISAWVLGHHYLDPAYAKPDWRTIAHTVQDYEAPGDAIIITGDGSERVFEYYYHGQAPIYPDFNTPAPPPERAIERLAEIAAQHRRIWYAPYGVEIDTLLEDWLARRTYPAWQSWLARQRLALYAVAQPGASTEGTAGPARPVGATFTDAAGVGLRLEAAAAPAHVAAGDVAPLRLTWIATASLNRDYQVSLRLINDRGDRFAQADWPPLAASGATFTWRPGEAVTDRRGLWLPADVSPGDYSVEIVVYDAETGQSLGAPRRVTPLKVMPAERVVPLRSLSIPHPARLALGDVAAVGYALPERLQPGQDVAVWLYWQAAPAENRPVADGTLRLTLDALNRTTEAAGDAHASTERLSASVGSLATWQAGQVRRAVYHLTTSPRLTGEWAAVRLTLTSDTGAEWTAELPPLALQQRARQFGAPRVAHSVEASFGNPPAAALIGFDTPGQPALAGGELAITLHWQALAEMDINFTVFVQVLSADWKVVAQVDRPPLDGAAPTNTWLVGEYLSDSYRLPLPAGLAPGAYRIIAGLYDAQTGQRLPVSSGGDFVDLGRVDVSE